MINTTSQAKIPTALYIHTPWCIHKCPYCDFNSHKAPAILPETDFLNKLIQDFDADLNLAQNRKIESIFLGGGTPSLLSGSIIGGMLKAIRKRVVIKADAEITLEANPGASESSRFSEYIAQGVNRLSLGIQSFDDSKLARLGRIHNSREAKKAFLLARSAGFKRINIDLMHGLPQQSIEGALDDLKQAIELDPEHISWYQLTIEQNTEFYRSPPVLPEEDLLWEINQQGKELLAEAGYAQYEVSAYAKDKEKSRHNLNYWQFGDYIGIGPGAHGKLTLADGRIVRTRKTRMPDSYLSVIDPRVEVSQIKQDELLFEFMLNALRLKQGCDWSLLEARTGIRPDSIQKIWRELLKKELVVSDRIATSPLGYQYLNQVIEAFL